ncbi:site-2 protease family protein [Synechococcus sp. CS-602]|uniref:site-2 protease family protein n=1 Tax=unclassified Synechococcus TaxID=2626047 RepID=UPI0008FF5477|nr:MULTISPECIES: site-2 protease family protein [unclassified Synechococcus]APD49639.1 multidrug transporter [Synechococcus sp. SynAce01]MCT0205492.1 site-2 protease family protein [Synechococcus sp. CS-602]MCT0246971.1 site-2 protease family protein [Synechococcus sp. CS-601]
MGEGWLLLKIRGIPLRIHPSWFVILGLATVSFEQQYGARFAGQASVLGLWLMALLTALLLFVSVLLHELGHSFVAMAYGVKVRSITLFLLGGVATVERECSTALSALQVAAAGPLVSLVLASVLLLGSHSVSHAWPLAGEVVQQLGVLNLVLGLFNLLPGLPLDGGLIVKALVWQFTGSQRRGIQVAAGIGRFLSLMAIGMGTLFVLRGGGFGAFWLILLGWFGLGASRNQLQQLSLEEAMRELKVGDAAARRFRVLESDASLRDLSQLRLSDDSSLPADWVLICDRGRWQGVIDDQALQSLPVQRWDGERVGDHHQPLDSLPSITSGEPLWQAALKLDADGVNRLLVLSNAGLPSGTIERPELSDAVLKRLGLRLPAPLIEAARRQGAYPLGLALGQVARSMANAAPADPDPEPLTAAKQAPLG